MRLATRFLALLLAMLPPALAGAMTPAMTGAQLQALKADILANPDLSSKPNTPDGADAIAALYNMPATPAYHVWRTNLMPQTIMGSASFDWARVDNLSVGKARIWEWLMRPVGGIGGGAIDMSKANVRAGIEACFSVEGADGPNRQAAYDLGSRPALRGERIFVSCLAGAPNNCNGGAAPTNHGVGPALLVLEGNVTRAEVETARALP